MDKTTFFYVLILFAGLGEVSPARGEQRDAWSAGVHSGRLWQALSKCSGVISGFAVEKFGAKTWEPQRVEWNRGFDDGYNEMERIGDRRQACQYINSLYGPQGRVTRNAWQR